MAADAVGIDADDGLAAVDEEAVLRNRPGVGHERGGDPGFEADGGEIAVRSGGDLQQDVREHGIVRQREVRRKTSGAVERAAGVKRSQHGENLLCRYGIG